MDLNKSFRKRFLDGNRFKSNAPEDSSRGDLPSYNFNIDNLGDRIEMSINLEDIFRVRNKLQKVLDIYPEIKEITLSDDDWKALDRELNSIARNPSMYPRTHQIFFGMKRTEIKNIESVKAMNVFVQEHQDCVSREDFERLFKK